jgi:hypothetical protein
MDYSACDPESRLQSTPRSLGLSYLLPCAGWFSAQGSKAVKFSAATICQAPNEFNSARKLKCNRGDIVA